MRPFTTFTGIAAPLPEADVDTDIIFPARFLLLLNKEGLGEHLFNERRHVSGQPPFVLDAPPFDRATILVAGRNFGSGSTPEQADWAISDFGFRVVIAPSFGEIFFNNCVKNGVLPIVMTGGPYERTMSAAAAGQLLTINLEAREVTLPTGEAIAFDLDAYAHRMLLLGLDEIGMILEQDLPDIVAFEARSRQETPWNDLSDGRLDVLSHPTPGDARDDR